MALQVRLPLPVYGYLCREGESEKERGKREGEYSHLLVGIFCRVQRKFIHFHLNLQLCETVVEWVLTCRGFCPEIGLGGRVVLSDEGFSWGGAFRPDSFMHISCVCHWQHQQQPHYLDFNKPLGSRSRCTSTATGGCLHLYTPSSLHQLSNQLHCQLSTAAAAESLQRCQGA